MCAGTDVVFDCAAMRTKPRLGIDGQRVAGDVGCIKQRAAVQAGDIDAGRHNSLRGTANAQRTHATLLRQRINDWDIGMVQAGDEAGAGLGVHATAASQEFGFVDGIGGVHGDE